MDLAEIRKLVIIAMFSDDVLFKRLVLKGGNAISLVYGYGARGSLDVDFSIDGDFDDLEGIAFSSKLSSATNMKRWDKV